MIERLSHVTIIVKDIDDALDFYTKKLGFKKVEDNTLGGGYRWVTVAPKGQDDLQIVLQQPSAAMHGAVEAKQMLKQVGKGTTWVFKVDNCKKTCDQLRKKGVEILEEPRDLPYGIDLTAFLAASDDLAARIERDGLAAIPAADLRPGLTTAAS